MKMRFADVAVKSVAVAGLAVGLLLHNTDNISAQQADAGNFFASQTVPAGVRWGEDRYDAYAPVELETGDAASLRLAPPAGEPRQGAVSFLKGGVGFASVER
jgi:hypothetical protein